MIKIIHGTRNTLECKNILLTIGNFDGIHIGHKKILLRMHEDKKKSGGIIVAYTFHPHPRAFFNNDITNFITPLDEKIAVLEKSGVDVVVIEKFTNDIAELPYQTFFQKIIHDKLHPQKIYTGINFRFGKNREGDVEALRNLAVHLHIEYEKVDSVFASEGQRISSSTIRSLLLEGSVAKVREYLGRPYTTTALVIHGDRRGRTIDIPTANSNFGEFIPPKDGVYAVTIDYNNTTYHGVANIMIRDGCPLLEVHIFDFDEDLYTKKIRVYFVERIRDEMKFKTSSDLKNQIGNDIVRAKEILKSSG